MKYMDDCNHRIAPLPTPRELALRAVNSVALYPHLPDAFRSHFPPVGSLVEVSDVSWQDFSARVSRFLHSSL